MAEPSTGRRSGRSRASAASTAPRQIRPKRPMPGAGDSDPAGGPDYVDEWMKRNVAPSVVNFVQQCCTSFLRWDLLRQLHADPADMTPESLARAVAADDARVSRELENLASKGVVSRRRRAGRTTYLLEKQSPHSQALEQAIIAYQGSQEFRFALVYCIVRASHSGATGE